MPNPQRFSFRLNPSFGAIYHIQGERRRRTPPSSTVEADKQESWRLAQVKIKLRQLAAAKSVPISFYETTYGDSKYWQEKRLVVYTKEDVVYGRFLNDYAEKHAAWQKEQEAFRLAEAARRPADEDALLKNLLTRYMEGFEIGMWLEDRGVLEKAAAKMHRLIPEFLEGKTNLKAAEERRCDEFRKARYPEMTMAEMFTFSTALTRSGLSVFEHLGETLRLEEALQWLGKNLLDVETGRYRTLAAWLPVSWRTRLSASSEASAI